MSRWRREEDIIVEVVNSKISGTEVDFLAMERLHTGTGLWCCAGLRAAPGEAGIGRRDYVGRRALDFQCQDPSLKQLLIGDKCRQESGK